MLQARDGVGLALESLTDRRMVRVLGEDDLEHLADRVPLVTQKVHRTHAALGELPLDDEVVETTADQGIRHRVAHEYGGYCSPNSRDGARGEMLRVCSVRRIASIARGVPPLPDRTIHRGYLAR